MDVIKERSLKLIIIISSLLFIFPIITHAQQHQIKTKVRVFYITNRTPLSNNKFGNSFNDKLSYGEAQVRIPKAHKRGGFERPLGYRGGFTEDKAKHLTLAKIQPHSLQLFLKKMAQEDSDTLIYVHGYKFSFEKAIYRAAQLAYDLKFKGSVIAFSWPSQSSIFEYTTDQINAQLSSEDLLSSLLILDPYSKKTQIIAHSMGNIVLSHALKKLKVDYGVNELRLFDQIIMAAPDLDVDEFQQEFSHIIPNYSKRVSLLASSDDLALKTSALVNKSKRLGLIDYDHPYLGDGFDLIDASEIERELFQSTHHTYYTRSRVLDDFTKLFHKNSDPKNRGLQKRVWNNVPYWEIKSESSLKEYMDASQVGVSWLFDPSSW